MASPGVETLAWVAWQEFRTVSKPLGHYARNRLHFHVPQQMWVTAENSSPHYVMALDMKSTICQSYSEHINTALKFFEALLCKLEVEYGVDHSRLCRFNEDTILKGAAAAYLKDLMYKIFIHLGDLARYKVSLGGSPYNAVGFYHQAITLDPSIGTAYNQLAVLSGNKNEYLDSIYYYQRSMASTQPFSGSEPNLIRLFEKNYSTLAAAEASFARTKEPDVSEATRKIFLLQFIRIQHILYPGNKAGKTDSLNDACHINLKKLEICLEHDDHIFKETSESVVSRVFSLSDETDAASGSFLLPPDLVLKLSALSILPSYSLRQLGSTLTRDASTFALSVLSCLLQHSFQCICHLVISSIDSQSNTTRGSSNGMASLAPHTDADKTKKFHSNIVQTLESGKSMVEIFLEYGVFVACSEPAVAVVKSPETKQEHKKPIKAPTRRAAKSKRSKKERKSLGQSSLKGKRRVIVDRRRKRKDHRRLPSSEDEEDGEVNGNSSSMSDEDSDESRDSDKILSLPDSLGEDDLDLLNALSDPSTASSSSEDEQETNESGASADMLSSSSGEVMALSASESNNLSASSLKATKKSTGNRRQIILAANFSMGSDTNSKVELAKDVPESDNKLAENSSWDAASGAAKATTTSGGGGGGDEGHFMELLRETDYQAAVYTSCALLVHERTLMGLRLFTQWLTSYPIVFATCTQNSTTLWSRIARLLNILPSQQDIATSSVAGIEGVQVEDKCALVEDVLVRGFPALHQTQETLNYGMDPLLTPIQEVCYRINSLQRFGHLLAEAKTAPLFTWDKAEEKFIGPEQKWRREQESLKIVQEQEKKEAELNRSKLMKAMAQRKLKSEVETLAEASNKTEENPLFTPYLIPDASSLCTGLHIVKKLIKTEKFIFIIAKSVIEALDSMKKSRESYSAREVIKFLEKELHSGNKYIQAQKPAESLQPDKIRPSKTDMQDWMLERLVDCACYLTETQPTSGRSGSGLGHSVATLILEKSVLDTMYDTRKQPEHSCTAELLTRAQQRGVELETMISFHINWSKHSRKVQREK